MKILGAGLAGLIAAHAWQRAEIFEQRAENTVNHRALLRFRSDAVGQFVGIAFRKVRVHKGIYADNSFVAPSIRLANLYAKKVTGSLIGDRSIWNIEPVDRWIAPEDFIEQLIDRCANRISWSTCVSAEDIEEMQLEQFVSTIPMIEAHKMFPRCAPNGGRPPTFSFKSITVERWRIGDADLYQTIYFPLPNTEVYRASMTGDVLIIEAVGDVINPITIQYVKNAFGIMEEEELLIGRSAQRFGKIVPIDDGWRKQFMFNLTMERGIYSLGRFATWRNLLLDDVLHDISVIKQLMNASRYELRRAAR